jgi:serine/threonine protein kinase
LILDSYPGGTLQDIVSGNSAIKTLSLSQYFSVAHRATQGVQSVHSENIVHLHLDPGAFLLSDESRNVLESGGVSLPDGGLVLSGFGHAYHIDQLVVGVRRRLSENAAPEERQGKAVTSSVDVYGLGRTLRALYDVVEADSPVREETTNSVAVRRRLDDFLTLMMSTDPYDRPSISKVVRVLGGMKVVEDNYTFEVVEK